MLHDQNYGFWRTAADCLIASMAIAVLTFAAFRLHATTPMAALPFFIVLISLCARFVARSLAASWPFYALTTSLLRRFSIYECTTRRTLP
jgi:hypothetical protein